MVRAPGREPYERNTLYNIVNVPPALVEQTSYS